MNTAKKVFRYLALILLIVFSMSLLRDILFGQFSFQENRKLETLINEKEYELANIAEENETLKDEIILLKKEEFFSQAFKAFFCTILYASSLVNPAVVNSRRTR